MIMEFNGKFPKFDVDVKYSKSKDGKYLVKVTTMKIIDIKSVNYFKKILDSPNESNNTTPKEDPEAMSNEFFDLSDK